MRLTELLLVGLVLTTVAAIATASPSASGGSPGSPVPYTVGSTLIYNVTFETFIPNESVTLFFYVMNVTQIINESYVNTSLTIIDYTHKVIYPTIYGAGNASEPPLFFYVSPQLLGKETLNRGGTLAVLIGTNGTGYMYVSQTQAQGANIYFYIFVAKNGTITWAQTKQYNSLGQLQALITYRLWIANFSGPVKLNLTGYSHANFEVVAQANSYLSSSNPIDVYSSFAILIATAASIPLGYYLNKKGVLK
ncbi:MAG: hypothetical protein ACP5HQ_01540 [Thermoprotei archaeon]